MVVFNLKFQQYQNLLSVVFGLLQGYLIEVMLRIVVKVDSFCDVLLQGMLVYIVYFEGMLFDDMFVMV